MTDTNKHNVISFLHQHYFHDNRPWVIAYSGGKDSTLVLQLVYQLMIELGAKAIKPIHVIASDTHVEAPNISDYLHDILVRIEAHARTHGLPVSVHIVQPEPSESFWGKLIGKGYPSPTRWFRWCTTKMKIKPARRVIETIVRIHGSVVLLLGTRSSESPNRSRRMRERETNSRGLNPHHEIPDALVLTPIADWETDEVWKYLFSHNPPPWGGRHDFMLDLYRQAGGGECPMVLDLNTPSCGGSRFGCWTCTVVKEDRSMQGFIESGETWMQPLNTFRNWLKSVREKPEARDNMRRNNTIGIGPFNSETRKIILRRLLKTEQEIGRQLNSNEEIRYIQSQWNQDFDVQNSAIRIAPDYGREVQKMAISKQTILLNKDLIDTLAPRYKLQEAWVDDLLFLVERKYPTIDSGKAKNAMVDDVIKIIDNAVRQTEINTQLA